MITFHKGINTDVDRKLQPEGTYNYALNTVFEDSDGEMGGLPNEMGNILVNTLEYTIIGHVNTDNEEVVIFSTDNMNSEIGLFNTLSHNYTVVINTPCLNFNTAYPIFAEFRIRQGCERTIYFTDRLNKYRVINLDRISLYQDGLSFDCAKMSLSPDYQVPTLGVTSVNDFGGQLKVGAYQIAIRYLDVDENPSNWFYVSTPVIITDEPSSSPYYDIDGALPTFDNATPEPGAVPLTNKSLTIQISNLDLNQSFYQLAILESHSTTARVSEVWELDKRTINNDTETYTYSGASTSQGHFQSSLQDIIVGEEIIDIVQHHAQNDNTLILAGLKSKDYNYGDFQRVANDINVKWVTQNIPYHSNQTVGESKNPLTSHIRMNMMGGEVYALGIEFLLKNTRWTSAFHIPGREINSVDTIPVGESPVTTHLGTGTQPLWKVQSTSDVDGTLGYYETDTTYLNTTDCEGLRIFPEGSIRHHKMPDRRDLHVQDSTGTNLIGLEFTNITYPHSDIVGHRFVYGLRDDSNSTVIDTGMTIQVVPDPFYLDTKMNGLTVQSSSRRLDSSVILTPKGLLKKRILGIGYATFNYRIKGEFTQFSESLSSPGLYSIDIDGRQLEFFNQPITSATDSMRNRSIDGEIIVATRATQSIITPFTGDVRNESHSTQHIFIHYKDDISDVTRSNNYITLKRNVIPYSNLDSITYVPLNHNPLTLTSSQILYGGDTYISELTVVDTPFIRYSDKDVHTDFIQGFYVESSINFPFRHGGTTTEDCSTAYKSNTLAGLFSNEEKILYVARQVALRDDSNDKWDLKDTPCTEYYAYNDDFSKLLIETPAFPIQQTFNYCSDCIDDFPYRLIYSDQSYQEDLSDNYRIFRNGNRIDMDGATGNVNSLVANKGALYILTEGTPWFLPMSPQKMQTNEDTVYLGTGDRFSIPPTKLVDSTHRYGGTTQTLSLCKTEFGVVYVDDINGKVFLLSNKLEEVSNLGRRHYLSKAMKLTIKNGNALTDVNGTGIITSYDHKNRRVLIHKRDFKSLYPLENSRNDNTISWDGEDYMFWRLGSGTIVSLTDPDYFENKSITESFHIGTKTWRGSHSYLPTYMFHNNNGFYCVQDTSIWEQNTGEFTTFFGTKYPSIIEGTYNKQYNQTKVFNSIISTTTTEDFSSEYPVTINDSYTNGVFFTHNQTTGLRDFTLLNDDVFSIIGNTNYDKINRTDDRIQISYLYNLAINDNPIFTNSWSNIQNDYPIDKVVNPVTIDVNKSMFDQGRLRGDWLGVRLYFNPTENYKITTQSIDTNFKLSYR